jgi:hypothetical protein
MLKKCANSMCSNPFRVLSQGKLFQVEVDDFIAPANRKTRLSAPRGALLLTLIFEKARGMVTVPLPSPRTPFTACHWQ